MEQIEKVIEQVVNENKLKINLKNKELTLKETGIDSLALLNLIFKIETKLGVQLEDSELVQIKNLQDLINAFDKKINNK